MFLAHFGVAMAAKRAAPHASLGTLVVAAQLADVIWPVLVLLGIEQVRIAPGVTAVVPLDFVWYPYSHSLVFDAVWAALFAGGYYALRRDRHGAMWIAALVLSHWVLDVASHRPDMPLAPGSLLIGFGLWNSVPASIAVEALVFLGGAALYARATAPRDNAGRWSLLAFLLVLATIYVASTLGPPPPSERAVALSALGVWIFVAWAYAIDRHRAIRTGDSDDGPLRAHVPGH